MISEIVATPGISAAANNEGKSGVEPVPATMVHDLIEATKSNGTAFSVYSAFPFPNRSGRQLDNFESDAWKLLVANPEQSFVREEVIEGVTTVRVAIADKMVNETCVKHDLEMVYLSNEAGRYLSFALRNI